MKIQVYSDLHLEFEDFDPPELDVDVVVLAGDIHLGKKGLQWAQDNFRDVPVIYVLGNHEYYKKAYPKLVNDLKAEAANSNIHVLENDIVAINGVNFLGCTLWTDYELVGDARISGYQCEQVMTDFKKIRLSPKFAKLKAKDLYLIHKHSLHWLNSELHARSGQMNVVVTHHAPSAKSLESGYEDDIVNAAYASNLDDFVSSSGAELWIHGHIHENKDYMIGNTRVVCNPRGYIPVEPNDSFEPACIIKVGQ